MLTFQAEPVSKVWNELMVLANAHWAGTMSYRRHEPFNPSFERYRQVNESGFFRLCTARDGETLAGYFGVYVTQSMSSQKTMAVEDNFYLSPEYRGGRNALRFLKFVEEQCQLWGVEEILFSCEIDNKSGINRLLERLDFHPVIVQYQKLLVQPPADSRVSEAETPVDVGTKI